MTKAEVVNEIAKKTGIEKAAKDSGATLNFDTTVTEVENPRGKYLKKIKILNYNWFK
mgnify:CR=1 FL=1